MQDIEEILIKLFDYYQVGNMSELSKEIDVPQTTISKWKQRNSINSIKKKCKQLGIYKDIFENTNSPSKNSKEDINAKLFLFKRRSLVYIYYLLQKKDIKNSVNYFSWQIQKEEENIFKNFIDDCWIDIKNDNISFSSYRNEADQYISNFIKIDELDFIFQNKDIFLKSILFMTNAKR